MLRQGVQGISDLITKPGIVNVDFADVRAIMEDSGSALMGIGIASGENRADEAAKAAINSPLLDLSIDGAKGVLFNISGSSDVTMLEINEAANIITENIDPNAKVIFGAVSDDQIRKGEVQITVVATGFDTGRVVEDPFRKLSRISSGKSDAAASLSDGRETRDPRIVRETINIHEEYAPTPSPSFESAERVSPEEDTAKSADARDDIIFPTRNLEPKMIIEEKIQPRPVSIRGDTKEDFTDEDDLEIPAFIRRKMKK